MDLKVSALKGADRTWHLNWLRKRETGQKVSLGYGSEFSKFLYTSMVPYSSWEQVDSMRGVHHGGVFNLEFSPDGSLLVAACEKRSFLMFDALSQKQVHAVENAHRDCVNCVRFLDSRTFVTCSDDSTVALWDARNLKSSIRTLRGHSNWVKNIEYSANDGLLVTSGFDGSIYTWDINSYTENGFTYERVFHTNGLMRTRLTPDASKMIICTTGGYLMIIHDLDLRNLAQDLHGFKPNMYRLMQQSQTTIPSASVFTSLFSKKRKRNRIEFVSDFPTHNDAEVVSSLQIHPQGWCALSRNISHEELSEWTCVHDIQDRDDEDSMTENEDLPASLRDDSDEVMYDDEDAANDHRGFRGFPNPNYNSDSDSDGDSDLDWRSNGRRAPPPRSNTRASSRGRQQELDGTDSSSSSDSEAVNPRRAAQNSQQRAPVGRFHALLEITRYSSTTTRLLNDTSPLFRESPSSPTNNVSSSLPSRRPASRSGGPGEEVNSNAGHRRGGNIRRLRITVDGQVQVSDDDSSGEPASNVRVVDAQQSSRPAGTSRATASSRARSRFSLRFPANQASASHSSRVSPSDSQGNRRSSAGQRLPSAASSAASDSTASAPDRSSALSRLANLASSSAGDSDLGGGASPSPSASGASVSGVRRLERDGGVQAASSSAGSASSLSGAALPDPASPPESSPASASAPAPAQEPARRAQRATRSSSQSDAQDAARVRPAANATSATAPTGGAGPNETANAAAAVGAARQARAGGAGGGGGGGQGNIPLSQNMELHVASADVWEALVVIREARARRLQVPHRNPNTAVRDRRDLITRFLRRLQDLNEPPRQPSTASSPGSSSVNSNSTSPSSSGSNSNTSNTTNTYSPAAAAGGSTAEAGSSTTSSDRPRHVYRISRSRPPHRQGQAPAAIALGHFLRNPTPATRTLVMIAPHQGGAQNIHLRVSPNSYSYQSQQLKIPRNHKIHQNIPRLSHYIEEPNVGKGFIKELCFSSDGRVMCSPFSYGIRLLSFSQDCQEISTSLPQGPPVKLYEVSERICHDDYVVSSKFSPTHCLLVSGCLKGKIVWHQPYL